MLKFEGVKKHYKDFELNLTMEVPEGYVTGLIGANGAGKSTAFKAALGLIRPDAGVVKMLGKNVEDFTVQDKEWIGVVLADSGFSGYLRVKDILPMLESMYHKFQKEDFLEMCKKYQLPLDKKIKEFSTGMKRKLQIAAAVSHVADVLLLDEPTAVLTPQETDKLFAVMRNMKADGKSLIIITHKLHEVLDVSDRVAVLRKGEYIGDVLTKDADQQSLTDMMVGHSVSLNINRPTPVNVEPRLKIEGLTVFDELGVKRLDNVSFTVNAGEVLGVAGIAGSGQRELLESIAGLYPVTSGTVTYISPETNEEKNLVGMDPMDIRKSGVAMSFVPEDRLGMGLVGSMGMTGNMMLRSWRKGASIFLDRKNPEALAQRIWQELEVVTPSTSFPVRRMSGGNVQKVLVGREIAQQPSVLMTAYAVRGLDINTSYTIYNLLTEQKMKGVAVVYVGEDLDVLLELCDRIVVLCGGQVSGVVDGRKTNKLEVGALMTRVEGGKADE